MTTALAERARTAALSQLCALLAIVGLLIVRETTSPLSAGLLALCLLLPLLLPLPGLWQRRRRTYAWATLCLAPHFIFALVEIVANPALRPLAAVVLLLGTGLMVALVAFLRLTREEAVSG